MKYSRAAFTLIELLVVIAIIAILAAILFPVFAQAKAAAKKTQSLSNIKQIALANLMYAGDTDDMFVVNGEPSPSNGWGWQMTWMMHVQPYMKNLDVFRDPSDMHQVSAGTGPRYTYWANGVFAWGNGFEFRGVVNYSRSWTGHLEGRSGTAVTKPAETIMFAPRTKVAPGSGQTMLDGAFSAWHSVITIIDGVDQGKVLPGQKVDPWGKSDPTYKGLLDDVYGTQTVFSFVDGHAKVMNPGQTVNFNAPDAGGRYDSGFLKMWDALRDY